LRGGDGEVDCRGQAAVTDSLYFLIIVTGLCVLLFSYASSYGTDIDFLLSQKYNSDFCTDALKTILYSSTPRDPSESIYDPDAEIDHLLAYLKEDYFENSAFSNETMLIMQRSVSSVLAPREESFDYLFTLSLPSEEEYLFVFMHLSDYRLEPFFTEGRRLERVAAGAQRVDLFCNLDSASVTPDKVRRTLARAGSAIQSSAVVLLTKRVDTAPENLKVQADLIMWTPALLTESEAGNAAWYKENWNCREISDFEAA
jgi:hypothetical protein